MNRNLLTAGVLLALGEAGWRDQGDPVSAYLLRKELDEVWEACNRPRADPSTDPAWDIYYRVLVGAH